MKIKILTPDQLFDRLVERLPARVRPIAVSAVRSLYWILFLESAVSIITGRPFVRYMAEWIIDRSPYWLSYIVQTLWPLLLRMAQLWHDFVQIPIAQLFAAMGIHIEGWVVDALTLSFFAAGGLWRAYRQMRQFRTDVAHVLGPAQMRPDVIWRPLTYVPVLTAYAPAHVAGDLETVMDNVTTIFLDTMETTASLVCFSTRFRMAQGTIIERILPKEKRSERESLSSACSKIREMVLDGDRLTDQGYEDIAEVLELELNDYFTQRYGTARLSAFARVFRSTNAERRALRRAKVQTTLIVLLLLLVTTIVAIDAATDVGAWPTTTANARIP